ncbi:alpha/beta hydrolase [Streptomyces sp. HNM0575]|uniref:alpha/beta hydrolase n=1 Tax=Streptomyces sp. HNM0575 TaxID=2716338 RepID=UPI00145E862C|nr:alpha/beta hydrolase [Streptomyces sp. HNM0575]NLU74771.1 alpha/beta hydrolase [Streptomyces sp. HNM0575]
MCLRTAALAATSVTFAGAAALAAGRYAADAALRPARPGTSPGRAQLPAGFGGPPLTVHTVGDGHVSLTRSLTAQLPGVYGLVGRDCHAVVGPVLDGEPAKAPADTVVRRLERVDRGELKPGSRVWLTPQIYADDAGGPADASDGTGGTGGAGGAGGAGTGGETGTGDDGLPLRTAVQVPGDLGPLPGWFVPGTRDTWVVTLHGLGATPAQALPLLPFYAGLGLPVLGLAYRGDAGAPPPPDGVRHLGGTEWRDVEAAVRYAVESGARQVVLHGWSSGASMALSAAERLSSRRTGADAGTEARTDGDTDAHTGARADDGDGTHDGTPDGTPDPAAVGRIAGLVLDSPVLDWWAAVRALAAARHTPRALLPLAVRAAQGRAHVQEPERMRQLVDPAALDVPVLVLHGPDDTVASWQRSRELAEAGGVSVDLHVVPSAPHAAMWNADPEAYEDRVRRFLTPLM